VRAGAVCTADAALLVDGSRQRFGSRRGSLKQRIGGCDRTRRLA